MPAQDSELIAAIAHHTAAVYRRDADPDVVVAVLTSLVRTVVDSIATANRACILVVTDGTVTVPAATDNTAVELVRLERATGGGPCLAAAAHHRFGAGAPVDVAAFERWPALRRRILADTSTRSVLPIHLFRTEHTHAALAVFSDTPAAFDATAVTAASTVATVVGLAVHAAERERQFDEALRSRDLLGQAKGVLMERYSLDSNGAFEMLRRISQDTNTKVVTLAERLIDADHPSTPTA